MRFTYALAALAATTAFAAPASAQSFTADSSASIQARALLIQPATIQRVRDLSFGTIVASPTATGVVSVDADTGLRSVDPALTGSTSDVGSNGRFIGNGLPGQVVNLRVSFPSLLTNVQDGSQAVAFTGSLDSASTGLTRTIGLTGVFYVDVGGSIAIGLNQMPGQYEGTVTIDADFQ
ncbi:DUF4402 domain-containing protein [Sphingomonas sp. LHG3406-1]|uniref:DUF4402 domain-containing protein n=1 Tax=Sphingomonas sp. LHG3406-1 TaxID=2804617 RepID=UPI00262EAA4D|nr:DUF4402 domain-containing protein [Sphingomonas sp. LHG3406-1]